MVLFMVGVLVLMADLVLVTNPTNVYLSESLSLMIRAFVILVQVAVAVLQFVLINGFLTRMLMIVCLANPSLLSLKEDTTADIVEAFSVEAVLQRKLLFF